ncbi:MAG: hypothetical protein K9N06_02660 [Candidatus Cloacimonetes bacterium]|nr:hypothetical protein [Candidatus Cloacimonadota bacterium]
MKRILVIIFFLQFALTASCVDREIVKLQERDDIVWGYGEDSAEVTAREQAVEELASTISNWYLVSNGLKEKFSYGRKAQLGRLTKVWLDDFIADITEVSKSGEVFLYLEKSAVQEHYNTLKKEIRDKIVKAEEAMQYNKLGIYLRNLYWALILSDIIPDLEIEVAGSIWNRDRFIDEISEVVENLFIKVKGNEYHLGMRRLLFHVLYENRPVNDLRLGIILPEGNQGYSVEDRFLEIDLFGVEFEKLPNLSFMIDLQDRLTGVWGERIKRLGEITGMNAFEASKSIPLPQKKAEFLYWDEQIYPLLADSTSQREVEANLSGFLENIEYGEEHNTGIFSSEGVRQETASLLASLDIRNLLTGGRIKVEETASFRIWRGFKIGINFAGQIEADCNLVIKTDRSNRISGVWLGMKPIDYRVLRQNWQKEENLHQFLEIIEDMERNYTRNLMGRISEGFSEMPDYPEQGWKWAEIEDIRLEELENGALYEYKLILCNEERSWQGRFSGIRGGE